MSSCPQVGASFPSSINTSALLRAAASKSGPSTTAGGSADGRLLRVVLAIRRGIQRRTITNSDEVMEWCNAWKPSGEMGGPGNAGGSRRAIRKHPLPQRDVKDARDGTHGADGSTGWKDRRGNGPFVGAECVSYDFEDLLLSAALMQQADVLIAVHGENPLSVPVPYVLLPPEYCMCAKT